MSKQAPSKDDVARRQRRAPLMLRPLLWVRRLFATDVQLRRSGFRFRVVFVPPGSDREPPPPVVAGAPTVPDAPSNPLHDALRQLLAQHAGTRHLMRHLGFVERALKLSGPQVLDDLPADVLKKALAQLENLVSNWSNAGLSELRARLAVAVDAHEEDKRQFQPTNSNLSDFLVSQRMEVTEGSPSDFEELERIWIEHVPDVGVVPSPPGRG